MDMNSVYSPPANIFPPPANFPDPTVQIYVGSWQSATDPSVLKASNIGGVLNVAYDLDDEPSTSSGSSRLATLPDPNRPWQMNHAQSASNGQNPSRYNQQYAKVGLIDGVGNAQNTVLAAVYMADQLFTFPPEMPDPPLSHEYPRGNLLIHCYAGQSRSVTVASLYIYYKFGLFLGDTSVNDFQTVYSMVQAARNDPNPPPPPTEGMQQIAAAIVSQYSALFPVPVATSSSSK